MSEEIRERVLRLLAESPFVEGHNDTAIQFLARSDNDLNSFDLGSFDFDDDAPDEFLNFLSLLCHSINIHYEYRRER